MTYDAHWFDRLNTIELPSVQRLLGGDRMQRKREKERFLASEVDNPHFLYDHIDLPSLEQAHSALVDLRTQVISDEENQAVARAYSRKIDYILKEVDLLRAARNGDDEGFDSVNEHLYGDVDPDLFTAVCNACMHELKRITAHEHNEVSLAAQELLSFLEDVFSRLPNSSSYEFDWYTEQQKEMIDAYGIRGIFIDACEQLGLGEWVIDVDSENTVSSVTVNVLRREVRIPKQRHLTRERARALAMHELAVHARRRENGQRSSLSLLGMGLDHYLFAEEGLAKMVELEYYPGALNSALENYFFIALIRGVDQRQRHFRDIYNIALLFYKSMHALRFLGSSYKPETYAWARTSRFFKGSSGQSEGVCSRRHLAYLAGYVSIRQLVENGTLTKEEMFLGKYDPANAEHVSMLSELDIL